MSESYWILDNGECNSDHTFEFVRAPAGLRMLEYLAACHDADPIFFLYTASASAPADGWAWHVQWKQAWDVPYQTIEDFAGKPREGRPWVDWRKFLPEAGQ